MAGRRVSNLTSDYDQIIFYGEPGQELRGYEWVYIHATRDSGTRYQSFNSSSLVPRLLARLADPVHVNEVMNLDELLVSIGEDPTDKKRLTAYNGLCHHKIRLPLELVKSGPIVRCRMTHPIMWKTEP